MGAVTDLEEKKKEASNYVTTALVNCIYPTLTWRNQKNILKNNEKDKGPS